MKGFKNSTKTQRGDSCGCSDKTATYTTPVRKANGGAVNRGNRAQALEAAEEARLLRETAPRPTRGNRPEYTIERPNPAARPQRPARGPNGAGFNGRPQIAPPAAQTKEAIKGALQMALQNSRSPRPTR